jgi:hypothetical protein
LLVNVTPPGIAYEYINIWLYVPSQLLVTNASIKIKVDKAWIATNNIDPKSIAIYRYSDGNWSKLETMKTSENQTYNFYEATTPDLFSPFAITGEKVILTSTPTPTPAPTPTLTPTPIPSPISTPTLVPMPISTLASEGELILYLLVAGMLGGIGGFGLIVILIIKSR